jgi:type III pantothenate kinase
MGGAIAIGLALAARGLHELTYFLPLVSVSAAPEPLGKSTVEAMQSGLFWGTVGEIKELIGRVAPSIGGDPIVYLTGGDAELLAPYLDRPVEIVPELTLHGIYMAFQHVRSRNPT